jgi:DNA-binding LytR/AlgR family response regulator
MKRVLIVEDEPLIAEDVSDILKELGYQVVGMAESLEEVQELLDDGLEFDIVLEDVQIIGEADGIEVAEYIRSRRDVHIVFVTSFSDDITIKRIRSAQPAGYIVKPYKKEDIKTTLALISSPISNNKQPENKLKDILVKDGLEYVKIPVDSINFLEAADNYCEVHTDEKRYLLSLTLKATLDKLPSSVFKRCHRSFAINIHKIDRVGATYILVSGKEIPFNEAFKKELNEVFDRL